MIRILLISCWMGILFLFTCSLRIEELVTSGVLQFRFDAQPDLSELLQSLPPNAEISFWTRKIGHAFCFFILAILLLTKYPSVHAFGISLIYAGATEILQLFFYRDGRLFDIGFDAIGIVLAIILFGKSSKVIQGNIPSKRSL
ncbi:MULTISPECIES: VanZ family protein [unclassified Bacillus (in: firmicutes)]|uniref:VanZ family protein n=1 Tax=unclassified Bacillus (in: firmicutes) TaxID=185979 RepID=UPI0008EC3C09|nr:MULTISPECIES: VanZ family protein [unclassified Bacillus (in: firmicutes)]SFB21016.1 VanZ like family protein [Bacillus sp. UNCCL13]SFQ90948.1 VanZ like family protein [Bacillus sp. cl95]